MKEEILEILWSNSRKDPNGSWESLFDNIATELAEKFKQTAPAYELQKKLDDIKTILDN